MIVSQWVGIEGDEATPGAYLGSRVYVACNQTKFIVAHFFLVMLRPKGNAFISQTWVPALEESAEGVGPSVEAGVAASLVSPEPWVAAAAL